ncbi:MAG: RNA-binding S4 domain-containing protein [Acholeplasmataceae bacterium]
MRLDKYLKVSRLIKRRTLAKEACEKGRIAINGKTAKPSADVSEGDLLTLHLGSRITKAKVRSLSPNGEAMFDLISEEKIRP